VLRAIFEVADKVPELRRAKRGAFLMDQGGGERAKELRIIVLVIVIVVARI